MQSFLIHILVICLFILTGCIEPIEFNTGSEPQRLVVEGLITNISYQERTALPEYAERFYVKLQWTGPVNNERNNLIRDATVTLYDDQNGMWSYFWVEDAQKYILFEDDFAAQPGRTYHLEVRLPTGKIYESLPQQIHVAPEIQQVSSKLETRLQEIEVQGATEFVEQPGIVVSAPVPEHNGEETFYYRWRVTPSWVYVAPLPPADSPVKTCYATNVFYFQKINTRLDRSGGYNFELFFLETVNNQRLFHDFSAYITQYSLSPEAFEFWDQLALQQESGGGIFDPPPFEITSNIMNINDPAEKVSGMFSVAHESSVRWFINGADLPYKIDLGIDPCAPQPGVPFIPTPDCLNCLKYRGGASYITTERPLWWRQY